eukprot:UN4653
MDLQPRKEATEMGPWHLVALFHWTNDSKAVDMELPLSGPALERPDHTACQDWHVFEFWSGTYERCTGGAWASVGSMQPRSCWLFSVWRARPDVPQLVGSDIHISCGLEVGLWQSGIDAPTSPGRGLQISLSAGRTFEAPRLWLSLPGATVASPPCVRAPADQASEFVPGEPALHIFGDVWRLTFPRVHADVSAPFHVEW